MPYLRLVTVAFLAVVLSGCQATRDWLDESDQKFARTIRTTTDSDVCLMAKYQSHGPKTTAALRSAINTRGLVCDEVKNSSRANESPAQREQRINEAIQLLNNAAQIGAPTSGQPVTSGFGQTCMLAGQSRSGLYMNCTYRCGAAGTVYRSFENTSVCPLSVSQ